MVKAGRFEIVLPVHLVTCFYQRWDGMEQEI